MVKRQRSRSLNSTYSNDDSAAVFDSAFDSEIEDASFGLKTKKTTSRQGHKTVSRRKKTNHASASSQSDAQEPDVFDAFPHPKSAHVVVSPENIRKPLLEWYRTVHDTRGMPWRRAYDPNLGPDERAQRAYEVWISEIMLQQTQVATVIPYYNRWMEKFPTIRDLAEATIDEVNSLWKGLGYYSRASRLLAGAQKAVKEYNGRLPDNAKDMEAKIPGIGRYSAGAICSIAYGEQVPVLDGNVHRLLSRVLALHAPPKSKPTLDILWAAAQAIVEIEANAELPSADTVLQESDSQPPQYPGDINQALIELGSTICKVREPNCQACPLRTRCSAYQKTTTAKDLSDNLKNVSDIEDACTICEPLIPPVEATSFPMKVERKKAREELDIVNVVEWHPKSSPRDRHILMIKRPEKGLLAGLYDFPTTVDVSTKISRRDQQNLALEILPKIIQGGPCKIAKSEERDTVGNAHTQSEGLVIAQIQPVGDVVHIFSHIKKTYRIQWVILEGGVNPPTILENPSLHEERPTKKHRKEKQAVKGVNVNPRTEDSKSVIWVPLDDVVDTNMGSGVVKVWNLTKKLWENTEKRK